MHFKRPCILYSFACFKSTLWQPYNKKTVMLCIQDLTAALNVQSDSLRAKVFM